jgi:hypothetical protein
MMFEQWLFSAMAKKYNRAVSTLLKGLVKENNYPAMADFWNASSNGYLHFMGVTKKNRYALKQLLSKVRKDHPQRFYEALKLCMENDVALDFKVYNLPELSPQHHTTDYFLNLVENYNSMNEVAESTKWIHYYGKDVYTFNQAENFNKLQTIDLNRQLLEMCQDVEIINGDADELQQHLRIPDTFSMESIDIPLDRLEMVLLDSLQESPRTIAEIVEMVKYYFDETDYHENKAVLYGLIIDRIKKLLYQGALSWASFPVQNEKT